MSLDMGPPLHFIQWMEIYISSRPPYSPRLMSDAHERLSRLSLNPATPFRIGLPMLSALSRKHGIQLTSTSKVAPMWDGSSPVSLVLRAWNFPEFVVTLGRCTRGPAVARRGAISGSKDSEDILGPHFITVQERSQLAPKCRPHICKQDHVQAGVTRRWRMQSITQWTVHDEPQDLQISFTRSRFDNGSGHMLEVHLDVICEGTDGENRVCPLLHNVPAL